MPALKRRGLVFGFFVGFFVAALAASDAVPLWAGTDLLDRHVIGQQRLLERQQQLVLLGQLPGQR